MSPRPPKPPRPWGWYSPRSRRSPSLERREKHEKHDHLKPRQDDPQTSTTAVRPQELASFISLAFAPAAQPFGVDPLYLNSLRHTNRHTQKIIRPREDTLALNHAPLMHNRVSYDCSGNQRWCDTRKQAPRHIMVRKGIARCELKVEMP